MITHASWFLWVSWGWLSLIRLKTFKPAFFLVYEGSCITHCLIWSSIEFISQKYHLSGWHKLTVLRSKYCPHQHCAEVNSKGDFLNLQNWWHTKSTYFSSATETAWNSHIHHLSLSLLGIPYFCRGAHRHTSSSKQNKENKNIIWLLWLILQPYRRICVCRYMSALLRDRNILGDLDHWKNF